MLRYLNWQWYFINNIAKSVKLLQLTAMLRNKTDFSRMTCILLFVSEERKKERKKERRKKERKDLYDMCGFFPSPRPSLFCCILIWYSTSVDVQIRIFKVDITIYCFRPCDTRLDQYVRNPKPAVRSYLLISVLCKTEIELALVSSLVCKPLHCATKRS